MPDVKLRRLSDGGLVETSEAYSLVLLAEKDEGGAALYERDASEAPITAGDCPSCEPTGWKPETKKVKNNA
jgi:hypothetical protein